MTYVGSGFSRTYISVVVAILLTAAIKPAALQNPPQPPQTTFRTEVNYVRVDAYPTRDGAPVLDLTQQDFEILESGVPQKIEQFERVLIRPSGPQDSRIEPNSVAESRSMTQNPRARVFVVFLDTYHVDVAASHNIRGPLTEALDRMIGAEDLVAVMTPEMSASDITFARKTTTIAGFLTRYWTWGDRDQMIPRDPEDRAYGDCYPNDRATSGIAAEMIDRRHEKRTIDALHDLVVHLGGLREERKAVLTISNGWLLYRPNLELMRPIPGRGVPTGPGITVEPRGGKLTTKDPSTAPTSNNRCEVDRMNLAQIDDETDYRRLLDRANGANVSFYPVDPRGLAVFDTPIVRQDVPGRPAPMVPLSVDRAMLTSRLTTLRTLAENTDGIAIVDTNDLTKGFRRVVDDLSSYYLLGYYSSGRLDGRFHPITVRVKRPGVQVRARRGYLAATPAEMTAARPAAPPKLVEAETAAIQTALAPLAATQRDSPLRVHVATGWKARSDGSSAAAFWVVGEFSEAAPQDRDVDVTVITASGATVGRGTGRGGARSVMVPIVPAEATAGEYTVRVRAEGFGTGTVSIALPTAPEAGGAIFTRRGPTTGNREMPTADLRFRRNERIRVDLPTTDAGPVAARLLDRTGKAIAIPLTATVREDRDGSRWQSTELALAPLAPGDYLIELAGRAGEAGGAGGEQRRTLVAFRVVP
jgi:VWFA-related protein